MTDRIHSLTVVLDHDIRDDDIEPIVSAIRQIRCVADVQPHVSDIAAHMAEERAHRQFDAMLHRVLIVSRDSRRRKLMEFLDQLIEEPSR